MSVYEVIMIIFVAMTFVVMMIKLMMYIARLHGRAATPVLRCDQPDKFSGKGK